MTAVPPSRAQVATPTRFASCRAIRPAVVQRLEPAERVSPIPARASRRSPRFHRFLARPFRLAKFSCRHTAVLPGRSR